MNVTELGHPELSSPPPWLRDPNDHKHPPPKTDSPSVLTSSLRRTAPLQNGVIQESGVVSAFHPVTSSSKHSNYVSLQLPGAGASQRSDNSAQPQNSHVAFVGFRNPPAIVRHNVTAKTSAVTQIAKVYPTPSQAPAVTSEAAGTTSFLDSLVTSHDADFQIISKIQDVKKRFIQNMTSSGSAAQTSDVTTSSDVKSAAAPSTSQVMTTLSVDVTSQSHVASKPTPIKLELPTTGSYRTQFKTSPTLASAKMKASEGHNTERKYMSLRDDVTREVVAGRSGVYGDGLSDFLNYDSDESSTSHALSNKFSLASTMSLSELLDRTKNGSGSADDASSVDTFRMFESDYECSDDVMASREGDYDVLMQCDVNDYVQSGREPLVTMTAAAAPVRNVQQVFPVRARVADNTSKLEQDYGDYVCLRKIREYIYVNMPQVTSSACAPVPSEFASPCDCAVCLKNKQSTNPPQSVASPAYITSRPYVNRPQTLPSTLQQNPPQPMTSSQSSKRSVTKSTSSSKSGSRISTPSTLVTRGEGGSRRASRDSVFEGHDRRQQSRSQSQSTIDEQYHDYVNITPDMLTSRSPAARSMTYVNLTPEKKEQVISTTKTKLAPPSSHSTTVATVHSPPNNINTTSQPKSPPATKPKPTAIGKPTLRCADVTSPSRTERSSSPDSAVMHRSCSSSDNGMRSASGSDDITISSGIRTLDRLRSARDEGYSSNSSNSIKTDLFTDRLLHNGGVNKQHGCRQNVNNNNRPAHLLANSRASRGSADQLRPLQPLLEMTAKQHLERGSAVTLTFCSRAHQLKRSHSMSCCCIGKVRAQIQSCILKSSYSVVDLRRTVMCVKAAQYVRQMAIIAKQLNSDRKQQLVTPQPVNTTPATADEVTGVADDDVTSSPIYENLQYYKAMLSSYPTKTKPRDSSLPATNNNRMVTSDPGRFERRSLEVEAREVEGCDGPREAVVRPGSL